MGSIHLQSPFHRKRRELLSTLKSEIEIMWEGYEFNNKDTNYVIISNLGTFVGSATFTEGDDYNEMVGKNLAKTRAYRKYNMEVKTHIEENYLRVLTKQMNYYKKTSNRYKDKEQHIQESIGRYYERKN